MNNYSTQKTGEYSREVAKILSDRFFQHKTSISGPELMGFSDVKQINLLIVKELLGRWHHEMANLKSPFFDFEAEPVKTSLAEFMNVLSQHILISRPGFEPLVQNAVANTVLLATDAPAFFEAVFLQADTQADLEKMRSFLRYMQYGKELFTDFINDLHVGNIERGFVLQRFKLYLNAHYKNDFDAAGLVKELNNVLPLPEKEAAAPNVSAPAAPKMPAAAPVNGVANTPAPAPVHPAAAAPAPQPVAEAPKAPVAAPEKPKAPVAETVGGGLNDRYKVERTSLNDKLRKPVTATLADTIGERKIESLKNSISINQRFAFINELFGGDNQAYHAAINQLDQQPTHEAAHSFVMNDLTGMYAWNYRDEHVGKLLRLIDRKFA